MSFSLEVIEISIGIIEIKYYNSPELARNFFYQSYFEHNLWNMKKTWEGINILIIARERMTD